MEAVTVTAGGDGLVDVALHGEIDFTNAPSVLREIRAGVDGGAPAEIRIDLHGVTFLDSSGIGVLVHVMNLAEERGASFRVERPGPKVLDQLHMSGLTEIFGLAEAG
jgi:anti-sigma B factor antagonist